MPSKALTEHLLVLLKDADELLDAQRKLLKTLVPLPRGKQWGIGSLNRAVVVMCVSAWEGYVEQVVLEGIAALRPAASSPPGLWPALEASTRSSVNRFNTPDVGNVRRLIAESLGPPDITVSWTWPRCTSATAQQRLARALKLRHQIAHGIASRPVIPTRYATRLPRFFQLLGRRTDAGIRDYLVTTAGVAAPWPP